MKNSIEYRSFTIQVDDNIKDTRTITGLAIPVESKSQLLGGKFYETISRNAVDENLILKNDVRLLYNHEPGFGSLGRSKYGEGSLRLYVEDDGLHFETELPRTSFGDTILEGLRRKEIDSCSFGFIVGQNHFEKNPDGTYNRSIESFNKLIEISLLDVAPAYLDTDVAMRSIDEIEEAEKSLEEQKKQEILDELKSKREEFNSLCEDK